MKPSLTPSTLKASIAPSVYAIPQFETLFSRDEPLKVATDSEWSASLDNRWMSTQFSVGNRLNFLYMASWLYEDRWCDREQIEDICKTLGVFITWVDDSQLETRNLFAETLESIGVPAQHSIYLLLFYSPKDLEYAFGWDAVLKAYRTEAVQQRRCLTGFNVAFETSYKVTLKDMKGWQPVGGLKSLADSVNVKMAAKDDVKDKTKMHEELKANPERFIAYAVGDVTDLHRIYDSFVAYIQDIAKEVLGVNVDFELPMTTGALVAKVFERFLEGVSQDPVALRFAFRKLGILHNGAKSHRKQIRVYNRIVKAVKTRGDIASLRSSEDMQMFLGETRKRLKFRHTSYGQASVQAFSRMSNSAAFNALVQGGRCVNENPWSFEAHHGADIDLKSCYGSALAGFTYPIGLPTVIGFQENQPRPTLGEFLRKWEKDFVEGLWTITVSGELDFPQDLIFSKLVTQAAINRAAFGDFDKETEDPDRDNDLAHMPGEFALILREIENGILTEQVLKTLRAVATKQELKSLYALEVVSAAFYKASDRIEDVEVWTDAVITDRGVYGTVDGLATNVRDTRTRAWFGVELKDFIGALVKERNRVKKLAKEDPSLASRDKMLKLFINTLYGVLASVFFDVGNTVVANNITAKARVGAWMMNKALHTRQSITDGGFYELWQVPVMTDSAKLPGLATLSDNRLWRDTKRGRTLKPLADRQDWIARLEGLHSLATEDPKAALAETKAFASELDSVALEHINGFWGRYGLELPFAIEHKETNTFLRAAYWNKAHYGFDTVLGKRTFKLRGARLYDSDRLAVINAWERSRLDEGTLARLMSAECLASHPTYKLLANILEGVREFPEGLEYDHNYLLKVGKFIMVQDSNGFLPLKSLRPGDEVKETRRARYNNTHFPLDTVADFQSRTSRKTQKSVKGEKVVIEWFEKFKQYGLETVHERMTTNNVYKR